MTVDPRTTIERYMEAFNSGQADVVAGFYAEDAVLHIAGNNPLSGTYRGRAAVRDLFNRVFEVFAGADTLHAEPPESVLSSDRHQMVFFRVSGERHGNRMDITVVWAANVGPDAKFQELWFLADDQAAYDRFFRTLEIADR